MLQPQTASYGTLQLLYNDTKVLVQGPAVSIGVQAAPTCQLRLLCSSITEHPMSKNSSGVRADRLLAAPHSHTPPVCHLHTTHRPACHSMPQQ
jgi:hypothetical protein